MCLSVVRIYINRWCTLVTCATLKDMIPYCLWSDQRLLVTDFPLLPFTLPWVWLHAVRHLHYSLHSIWFASIGIFWLSSHEILVLEAESDTAFSWPSVMQESKSWKRWKVEEKRYLSCPSDPRSTAKLALLIIVSLASCEWDDPQFISLLFQTKLSNCLADISDAHQKPPILTDRRHFQLSVDSSNAVSAFDS